MIKTAQKLEEAAERKRLRALTREANKAKGVLAKAHTKQVLKKLKARSHKILQASNKVRKTQLKRVRKSLKTA